jgi:hypothetical protein
MFLTRRYLLLVFSAILLSVAPAAHAQATRTWVSGVGDDLNPCSRTAPCKTFAGAISKTATNGEINCLDPGGYGSVTITRSLTIDCTGTLGSVFAPMLNGVIINVSAQDARKAVRFAAYRSMVQRTALMAFGSSPTRPMSRSRMSLSTASLQMAFGRGSVRGRHCEFVDTRDQRLAFTQAIKQRCGSLEM